MCCAACQHAQHSSIAQLGGRRGALVFQRPAQPTHAWHPALTGDTAPATLTACAGHRPGATAGNYYLGGQTPAAVVEGAGRLDAANITAARDASGRLQAAFTLRLPHAPAQLTAQPFLCGPAPSAVPFASAW